MQSDFWVGLEELCDLGGLMSRQIVEDDMYFALSLVVRNQLLQEGTNSWLVWRRTVLPKTSPAPCRRRRREKASHAGRTETVSLGPPGRQRQDWVPSIQGLDRRFLINTKHRRVLRRIHI